MVLSEPGCCCWCSVVEGVLGRLWVLALLPPTAGFRDRFSDFCELDEYSPDDERSSGATWGMFLEVLGGNEGGGGMACLSLAERPPVKDLKKVGHREEWV